jgi:Trypsin-like peptidase domain
MNRFLLAVSLTLLGAATSCARRVPIPSAVREAVESVCRPRFLTADWTLNAGTAFLAATGKDEPPLLLTVIHIFGPAGGLNRQIPSNELAGIVTGANCQRLNGGPPIEAGRPLSLQGAQPAGGTGLARDVAAFPATEQSKRLSFARRDPHRGARVWLVGQSRGGASAGQLIHGARVVQIDSGWLYFEYDDETSVLNGTSGAPVLNEAGEVVGINAGASQEDGSLIGFAVGVEAARRVLAR